MRWYRVYLYSGSTVMQGRNEFQAEHDVAAMTVAEHLRDACSDLCDTFELWDGARRVDVSFSKLPQPSVTVEQISFRTQTVLIQCEEAIRNSHWAVARSQRLIDRMTRLLAERR